MSETKPMTATHSPTPWELVEATEHHGPYICNVWGGDVCDLYTMSNPSMPSTASGGTSRPISFVDADANAAFIVEAVNSHEALKTRIGAIAFAMGWTDLKGMTVEEYAAYLKAKAAAYDACRANLDCLSRGAVPVRDDGAERIRELEELGQFLVDRLEEFDPGDDQPEREFHGHVAPAAARLRSALQPKDTAK